MLIGVCSVPGMKMITVVLCNQTNKPVTVPKLSRHSTPGLFSPPASCLKEGYFNSPHLYWSVASADTSCGFLFFGRLAQILRALVLTLYRLLIAMVTQVESRSPFMLVSCVQILHAAAVGPRETGCVQWGCLPSTSWGWISTGMTQRWHCYPLVGFPQEAEAAGSQFAQVLLVPAEVRTQGKAAGMGSLAKSPCPSGALGTTMKDSRGRCPQHLPSPGFSFLLFL